MNILVAKQIAVEIEKDMLLGQFDPTLIKYNGNRRRSKIPINFVEQFEFWVKNYKQMDCDVHSNYSSTRSMIRKWGRVDANNIVSKINAQTNAPVTYNRRLALLKSFVDWLVEQQLWQSNPLASVRRKKVTTPKLPNRQPFTQEEISRILQCVKSDAACSRFSNTKHSHYYPFMYFIFKTGVRIAEAVGLRVKHIDTNRKMIHICEVLARDLKSPSSKKRKRKSTKNEKERYLPLTIDLQELLTPLIAGKKPDDLVFLSPNGKAIDDNNFSKRVFKKVLEHLNIAERVLYAARHTFGSRCIDEGMTPVMTAFLMGNNPETALRRYTHQLNIPTDLPKIE